jgi:hypothetical protein
MRLPHFSDVPLRRDCLLNAVKQGGTAIRRPLYMCDFYRGYTRVFLLLFMKLESIVGLLGKGTGSRKLTRDLAVRFRPDASDVNHCASLGKGDVSTRVCKTVEPLALGHLPTMYGARPSRNVADMARRGVCAIQRACPVADHKKQRERSALPCQQVKATLELFLGKG